VNDEGRLLLLFDGFDEMERKVSDFKTALKIAQGLDSLQPGEGIDGEELFAQLAREEIRFRTAAM
jgi:hypothetical protein